MADIWTGSWLKLRSLELIHPFKIKIKGIYLITIKIAIRNLLLFFYFIENIDGAVVNVTHCTYFFEATKTSILL